MIMEDRLIESQLPPPTGQEWLLHWSMNGLSPVPAQPTCEFYFICHAR
jgi:hypothetical protein